MVWHYGGQRPLSSLRAPPCDGRTDSSIERARARTCHVGCPCCHVPRRLSLPSCCYVPRGHAPPWADGLLQPNRMLCAAMTALTWPLTIPPAGERKLLTRPSMLWMDDCALANGRRPLAGGGPCRRYMHAPPAGVRCDSGQRDRCRMVWKKKPCWLYCLLLLFHVVGRSGPVGEIITTGRSNHAVAHPNPRRDTSSLVNRHADYATRPRSLELSQLPRQGTPRGSDVRASSNR
jgi:hypothetical protein